MEQLPAIYDSVSPFYSFFLSDSSLLVFISFFDILETILLTFGYIFFFSWGGWAGGSGEGRRPGADHCGGGAMVEPPSFSLTELCVLERPRCNMIKNGGENTRFKKFKKKKKKGWRNTNV